MLLLTLSLPFMSTCQSIMFLSLWMWTLVPHSQSSPNRLMTISLHRIHCKRQLSNLRQYSGEPLIMYGEFASSIQYQDQKTKLPLLVAGKEGPTLLGRNWLRSIRLDWNSLVNYLWGWDVLPLKSRPGVLFVAENHYRFVNPSCNDLT